MKKKQVCDLQLCLLSSPSLSPPAPLFPGSSPTTTTSLDQRSTANSQQLTIFYQGQVSVCDVTEIQARTIIWQAMREMEDQKSMERKSSHQPQLQIPPPLSMKRSLQRFLQKRKKRIHSTSPYQL